MNTAAAASCQVVHATLNWVLIGALLAFTVAIAGAVAWSIVDRRCALRPQRARVPESKPFDRELYT